MIKTTRIGPSKYDVLRDDILIGHVWKSYGSGWNGSYWNHGTCYTFGQTIKETAERIAAKAPTIEENPK
jgi:hypothetical protein